MEDSPVISPNFPKTCSQHPIEYCVIGERSRNLFFNSGMLQGGQADTTV